MAKFPLNNRILTSFDNRETEFSGDTRISLASGTVFGFLDEGFEGSPDSISDNVYGDNINEGDADEEKENIANVEDNSFWETQHQLLETTLCRTTPLESRIRQATKQALKEAKQAGNVCDCRRPVGGGGGDGCRNCLMNLVCSRLQNDGFNSAICKSKWRSSPEIPSGEHTFLEVRDCSNPKRGEVRVIVELNLRAEFEMARASEEYNRLVKRLPEVFVGKIERLLSIIKISCAAAKKCMKEKKMHMGPWRKQRYMQAKWLRTAERLTLTPTLSTGQHCSQQRPQPRASMLTVDLSENLPNLHCKAVEVV